MDTKKILIAAILFVVIYLVATNVVNAQSQGSNHPTDQELEAARQQAAARQEQEARNNAYTTMNDTNKLYEGDHDQGYAEYEEWRRQMYRDATAMKQNLTGWNTIQGEYFYPIQHYNKSQWIEFLDTFATMGKWTFRKQVDEQPRSAWRKNDANIRAKEIIEYAFLKFGE